MCPRKAIHEYLEKSEFTIESNDLKIWKMKDKIKSFLQSFISGIYIPTISSIYII